MPGKNSFLPGDKVVVSRQYIANTDHQAFPKGTIMNIKGELANVRLMYVGEIITVPLTALSKDLTKVNHDD